MASSPTLMDQIMDFEAGELSDEDVVRLFQTLVDNKLAWSLQGHYGRTARQLIDKGLVKGGSNED